MFLLYLVKTYVITLNRLKPATWLIFEFLCKTHVKDKIFTLSLIHNSVIIRVPQFAEFSESFSYLGKTPLLQMI